MGYLDISKLQFGFNDAVAYKHKNNKEMFSRIFIRTSNLEDLMHHNSYFIIGDKGYGKTALSVYISNNSTNNTYANTIYLGATDYTDFINLKNKGMWILSDYKVAWKVTLLYLTAQLISSKQTGIDKLFASQKYRSIRKLISEYEQYSRSPEISQAIKLIQTYNQSMESSENIPVASGKLVSGRGSSTETNDSLIKDKLRDLQRQFEEALREIRVQNNYIVFIDGIDVRPLEIAHEEYTECIRGLGNAAWELNSEYFSNMKGSIGNIRVVLLARVDILRQMQLHNISSKINDNSVIINWHTPMNMIGSSAIFSFTKKLLTWNQEPDFSDGDAAWRHYFRSSDIVETFGKILPLTLYRPRDIIRVLDLLKKYNVMAGEKFLNIKYLDNPSLLREYSEYMLSEVRDQISFNYEEDDYKVLLQFFDYFNGKTRLKHGEFTLAYSNLVSNLTSRNKKIPKFAESEEAFLQYLYDLSIIGYIEYSNSGARFYRWSYIERSPADLHPQVRLRTDYVVHKGFFKSLNLGARIAELVIEDKPRNKSSLIERQNSEIEEKVPFADSRHKSRRRRRKRY